MTAQRSVPVAVVTQKGGQRLRRGIPWVYRQDVATPPDTEEPGAVVHVVDGQNNPIGQAFWATRSPLALRLITRDSPEKTWIDDRFWKARLEASLKRRAAYANRDAYRVVHGEADLIPGLFVDRYGEGLTVQTLSEGANAR